MELTTLIFSKNRACQLELLLRSLNVPVTVLYFYDPEFKAGYDKLIKMYPSVKFVLRYDFKKQLLKIINKGTEYVMFLVDDDIMIEPFLEDCPEFAEFKKNLDILSLSLRLSPNYRYKKMPVLKKNKWSWKPYSPGGKKYNPRLRQWGYPMAVGGHIFRRSDIVPIILANEMKNPNFLEGALSTNPPPKPLIMCFNKPKIINNIVNQVQTDFPSHISGISATELEERFLKGEGLSLEDIKEKALKTKDCYLKTDYKFINDSQDNKWLLKYKMNRWSQRGEDGVLQKIFEVLEIKRGFCVDVGAYGRLLSNTYMLLEQGWSGVLIEANEERHLKLKGHHERAHRDAYCICAFVEPAGEKSLDNLLKSTPLPKDFEFLCIDIDGNDYYIWESLKKYSPLVVIIEFNSVVEYADYLQPLDGFGGASLSMMVKLGKLKGYELISALPFNAIFVKQDLFNKFGIKDNNPKALWTKDPRDKEYTTV